MNYKPYFALLFCLYPFAQGMAETNAATKKYDTSLPIEINADNLEVDQANQTALFSGNVDAVQGKIKVKSDRMTVYYRANGQKSAPGVAGTGPQTISKVKVNGNVRVNTLEEAAKGDNGVYDVEHSILQLEGSVILTQGDNIIQGDKLVYNLDTGKSVVSSLGQDAGKNKEEKKPKGRVKSVFVPDKK